MAAWRAAGLALGRISVNLFRCQLRPDASGRSSTRFSLDSGLSADLLELEITENGRAQP